MPAYTSYIFDVHKSYQVLSCGKNSFASPDIFTFKISNCLLVPDAILSQLQI